MINGEEYLRKKYPDCDENQYQPGGIDLKLGKIEKINDDEEFYGIINGVKKLPKYDEVKMNAVMVDHKMCNVYTLEPFVPYLATVENIVNIDPLSLQFYYPRSSVLRCGTSIFTAVGDPGYSGHLSFPIMNCLRNANFVITKGERFAQLVDLRVDGVMHQYDGDYNER